MTSKVYIVLFISIIVASCKKYQTINGDKSAIIEGNSLLPIKALLEKANTDTSYNDQKISVDYTRYSKEDAYYLKDKENEWELKFSGNYPDVHIKYCNNNFVILYCPVSGIINGLTLFSSDHDDLFLIDRKQGKKIVDIQSKEGGITKAAVKDNVVYFEYYEPDVVRYIKIDSRE